MQKSAASMEQKMSPTHFRYGGVFFGEWGLKQAKGRLGRHMLSPLLSTGHETSSVLGAIPSTCPNWL